MARNNFIDRVPNHPGRFEMTRADGTTEVVTLVRDDEASTEGTKLNAETLNQLAQLGDFSPADFLIDPETLQITLKNAGGGASEIDVYRNKAMLWRINNNFDVLIIHFFNDANDIDTSFFEGADIVTFFDASENFINKTSSDTLSFSTKSFSISGEIVSAGYSFDGSGDISASISFDDGATWSDLLLGENTPVASSDAVARLKITMSGECVIKNLCWGVEFI